MASFRADIAGVGTYGGGGISGGDRTDLASGSGSLNSIVLVIWLAALVLVVVGATIMILELNASAAAKSSGGQHPERALSSPVPSGSGVTRLPGTTSPDDSREKRSIRGAVWRDQDATDDDGDGSDGSVFGSDLPSPKMVARDRSDTDTAAGGDNGTGTVAGGGNEHDDDDDDGFDGGAASILKTLHRSNEARLKETILAYQCSPEPLLPLEEDPVRLDNTSPHPSGGGARRFSFISTGGNTGGGSVGSELLDFVLDEDDDGGGDGGGGRSGDGGGGTGGNNDDPDPLRSPVASPAAMMIAPVDPVAA